MTGRSFLVLFGFAIAVIGYAVVYDGAAALITGSTTGGVDIDPLPGVPNPHIKFGGHATGATSAFPWGRPGIIASLIPGHESGQGATATGAGGPLAIPAGGSQLQSDRVRYV